jgi:hypothetical protein
MKLCISKLWRNFDSKLFSYSWINNDGITRFLFINLLLICQYFLVNIILFNFRVLHSSGSFLLLHYSIVQKIPDFWECFLDVSIMTHSVY